MVQADILIRLQFFRVVLVFDIFPVYKFTSSNQDTMLYHAYKIKLEPYGTTVSSSGEAVDELLCKHVELCQVDVVAVHDNKPQGLACA